MFVQFGLTQGNVLIHCNMGKRRSPMLLLAWMISCGGYSLHDAMQKLTNESRDPDYDARVDRGWANAYMATRLDWVRLLRTFEASAKQRLLDWKAANTNQATFWNSLVSTKKLKTV